MFQDHFGLTALPFQLQPDPTFLFGSKGYHYTHQYLRFGLMQQTGFVVVTGEVGAGKTTLTQAFLTELDPSRVTAGVLVSTQLDADSLLLAIAQTFGIQVDLSEPDATQTTLRMYFTQLLAAGRRALLVIDEAQHLSVGALEVLQVLCDESYEGAATLQCYLIGQPELREVLQAHSLETLRRRIIAGCHLGPLDSTEVQPYIEHRLSCAGWTGRQIFADGAFAQIFAWTGGIPRRINLLCNRLMLTAFLEGEEAIDVRRVWSDGHAIYEETGALLPPPEVYAPEHADTSDDPVESREAENVAGTMEVDVEGDEVSEQGTASRLVGGADDVVSSQEIGGTSVMLCLVCRPDTALLTDTLAGVLRERDDLPVIRFIYDGAMVKSLGIADFESIARKGEVVDASRFSDWVSWFDHHLARHSVAAVLVCDPGNAAVAAALVAQRASVPVISVMAGERFGDRTDSVELARSVVDRIASLHFAATQHASDVLQAEGMPMSGVEWVGNLRVDSIRSVLPRVPQEHEVGAMLNRLGASSMLAHGYVLVAPGDERGWESRDRLVDLLASLRRLSRVISVVLCETPSLLEACARAGLSDVLNRVRVVRLPAQSVEMTLALLRGAHCLLTDRPFLMDAATLLDVPTLELRRHAGRRAVWSGADRLGSDFGWVVTAVIDILDQPVEAAETLPIGWDGRAAHRIGAVLSNWLPARIPCGASVSSPGGGV